MCIYAFFFAVTTCKIKNSNNAPGDACACKIGYKGTITWKDARHSGSCNQTKCTGKTANAPENGDVNKSKWNHHGSVATFSCNDGYVLSGRTAITCNATSADTPWPTPSEPPICKGMLNEMLT